MVLEMLDVIGNDINWNNDDHDITAYVLAVSRPHNLIQWWQNTICRGA